MSDKDFKKFDTHAVTHYFNVRLAKDAQTVEFSDNKMAKLTFVDSSRLDSDEEMWVEANVVKSQTAMASYLEKGDVLSVTGKLTMRRYGDDNSQVAHNLRNADMKLPIDLIVKLKERGFTPGSDAVKGDAPAAKKKGPGRPAGSGKKADKPAAKKTNIPVEIDLDDDDAENTDAE